VARCEAQTVGEEDEYEYPPDVVRSPEVVAERALALFAAVGRAFGSPSTEIAAWLTEHALWPCLTESEVRFVNAEEMDSRDRINFSWQCERLVVLLWALKKVATLPPMTEQCDASVFQDALPPYASISVHDFVRDAKLRPDDELNKMCDFIYDLHWHARDGQLNNRPPGKPVDAEIVQERHHAINWIVGYCSLPWDEVTTDT
jgi:hypothetical protein